MDVRVLVPLVALPDDLVPGRVSPDLVPEAFPEPPADPGVGRGHVFRLPGIDGGVVEPLLRFVDVGHVDVALVPCPEPRVEDACGVAPRRLGGPGRHVPDVDAFQPLRGLDSRHLHEGHRDVVVRHVCVAGLAAALPVGGLYHVDQVHELSVHVCGQLVHNPVVHYGVAVVAHQRHHGVVPEAHLLDLVQEPADVCVAVGDLPGVHRQRVLQLALPELVGAANRGYDPPAFVGVRVEVQVQVVLGRVPWLVGVELLYNKVEALVAAVPLKPPLGGPEGPGREPVPLTPPALYVGETVWEAVPHHPVHVVARQVAGVLQVAADGRLEVVRLLAPYPLPAGEAPVEVHGGLEHVVHGGEEGGEVAVVPEHLGGGDLVLGYGLPPWYEHHVALRRLVAPAGERTHPGVHGPPDWKGGQRLGVGVGVDHALRRQGVHAGGLDPVVAVGPHVVPPETI